MNLSCSYWLGLSRRKILGIRSLPPQNNVICCVIKTWPEPTVIISLKLFDFKVPTAVSEFGAGMGPPFHPAALTQSLAK